MHYSNSCVTTCLLGAKRSRLESWPDATQSDRKKAEQTIAWAGLTSKLEANDRALGKGDIFGCHIGAGRSASTVPPPSPPRSRSVFFFLSSSSMQYYIQCGVTCVGFEITVSGSENDKVFHPHGPGNVLAIVVEDR